MIQKTDGSGTITFGPRSDFFVSSSWTEEMYSSFSPSFQMIENVSKGLKGEISVYIGY